MSKEISTTAALLATLLFLVLAVLSAFLFNSRQSDQQALYQTISKAAESIGGTGTSTKNEQEAEEIAPAKKKIGDFIKIDRLADGWEITLSNKKGVFMEKKISWPVHR